MGLGKLPPPEDYKWELYNVAEDFSQAHDVAAQHPEKLKELQQAFVSEAEKYHVFPLDNDVLGRILTPRPSNTAGRTEFTYPGPVTGTPDAPSTLGRSYTIRADVEIPASGAQGMIVTDGGRFGGYGLYLVKGRPVFTYNLLAMERFRWQAQGALAPGKHTLAFDFTYDGPGVGKGGTGVLSVDGQEVARNRIPHTTPFLLNLGETLDIGSDTRTGVDDRDYQVPFEFTGKIDRVTFKLGPPQIEKPGQQSASASAPQAH